MHGSEVSLLWSHVTHAHAQLAVYTQPVLTLRASWGFSKATSAG